jgi:hypothetical protein
MVSLASVSRRFELPFQVIEGGSGVVMAILSETDQNSQPSYVFVQPRHVLRTPYPTALRAGMVIQSPGGSPFIVGANGPSEQREGTLWQSFRLFEPTGRYPLSRRTRIMDPIARQEKEGPIVPRGLIWAALEPLDREQSDREMRVNFEQSRFITGAAVADGDLIDNRAITKLDRQLGLAIGVLT